MTTPLLSVRCLCYNHAPYLRQCLDGFVMQQTDFPFEVIIHDDASTDGSQDIIREYAERYPDIIRPIYETENQYGKGKIFDIINRAMHPDSKYIALCEADDCWTDPHKLQLQVSFLESHPDYVMSSHIYTTMSIDTGERKLTNDYADGHYDEYLGKPYRTFTLDDYFHYWFVHTLTIVYRRRDYIDPATRARYPYSLFDNITRYYIIKQGKCAYFKVDMATYRLHPGGIYSHRDNERWRELFLGNNYVLYQTEHDPNVLHMLNRMWVRQTAHFLRHGRVGQAWRITRRHVSIVPAGSIFSYVGYKIRKTLTGHDPLVPHQAQ